ncbi:MAG TPA: dephospho-CoA kinase [Epsilonproteobacteria bacterium]|nr:dephospho-CoA kinase [Campylobacterota bacterium]
MSFKYAIALTGSIATGKSTVAKFFTLFGFTVIDADRISHKILQMQQETIGQLFGKNLIVEGKVDRKALGRIIFSDKQKRKELEALLHPLIFDEIKRLSTEEEKLKQPYFVDIPLFFENGRYPIEKSLVVYTPKYIQLKRLVLRDGYNEEEALRRIETQIDVEEKRKRATYIIDNTDDLIALKHECMRVKEKIEKDFS